MGTVSINCLNTTECQRVLDADANDTVPQSVTTAGGSDDQFYEYVYNMDGVYRASAEELSSGSGPAAITIARPESATTERAPLNLSTLSLRAEEELRSEDQRIGALDAVCRGSLLTQQERDS